MSKKVLHEGPDISYHNGNVDIKRVRNFGCKTIGLRAGYGKNNIDQKYIVNALACYNLNVNVLLYWFSYAYNTEMAKMEADYAIAQASKYWGKCPVAYDFEYDSVNYARKNGVSITKTLCTDMAIAFLKQIKDAGYIPVIYTNRDYLKHYFDMDKIVSAVGKAYVWYARYTSALSESELDAMDVWQYSSTERIDGASGNVDMNKFYTDFSCETSDKIFREEKCNLNIKSFQQAANIDGYLDMYGDELKEDGVDGIKTQFVRRQISLKAIKNKEVYNVGSSGQVVKWWQRRCNEILSHSQDVDGLYGRNSRDETIAVQQNLNLAIDGIAGYNSIQALFYN